MKRFWLWSLLMGSAGVFLALVLGAFMTFEPIDKGRYPTMSLRGDDTLIAALASRLRGEEADTSGFVPLVAGNDALGARLRLIEAAESSIDIKTFLIKH